MGESDRELMDEMDRAVAAGRELEGYERAPGIRTSKNLTVTYGIRMTEEEYRRFVEGARALGMSLADLMRSATRAVLAGEQDLDHAQAAESVKALEAAMNEAQARLASVATSLGVSEQERRTRPSKRASR